MMPPALFLKTVASHVLPVFKIVSRGRVNLVPVTPFWLEVEVLSCYDFFSLFFHIYPQALSFVHISS